MWAKLSNYLFCQTVHPRPGPLSFPVVHVMLPICLVMGISPMDTDLIVDAATGG